MLTLTRQSGEIFIKRVKYFVSSEIYYFTLKYFKVGCLFNIKGKLADIEGKDSQTHDRENIRVLIGFASEPKHYKQCHYK